MTLSAAMNGLLDTSSIHPKPLHPGSYTDPEFWAFELQHVLRMGWHAVARADELSSPGDYRSLDLFGEPVLLVRDESRRLRAFSRTCLHRAFPIVEGEGNTKRFTCPYHRWGYDLEGRLRAAPLMDEVEDFDRNACRLPELALERWQGFVVVNLDPTAQPLSPAISGITEVLAPIGLEDYRIAGTLEYDSPWNWKVLVENFMESYHHIGPHLHSLQPSNPAAGTFAMEIEGEGALLENPAVEGESPFWVGHVFPTLLFAVFHDGPISMATWYEMRIDAMDHFELRIHLLLPEAACDHKELVAGMLDQLAQVHAEDIEMCEGVWKGLASQLFEPRALANHEACLTRFHRYLANQMKSARARRNDSNNS